MTQFSVTYLTFDSIQEAPEPVYEKGTFDAVKDYIIKHIMRDAKAVSMSVLHELYGLSVGDSRYCYNLKRKIEEHFPTQICFVTAKVNNPEVVISNEVFKNTIYHSINRNTTIEEAASLIREDIKEQCTLETEKNCWPPKLSELQQLPVPDSVKLFFQTLLATEKHGTSSSEKSSRLIKSFAADMISNVSNGSILTAKHFLLAVGLHSITGMKQIIQILHKMGHCMSCSNTCEIETAMAESTLARIKQSNILPLLPIGQETVLTYFWADNFDQKVESQQGGKMFNTTHLMALQEVFDGSDVFVNTNDDSEIPRTKRRRVEYQPNEFPYLVINKSQESPKFTEIMHSKDVPAKFNSLLFIWLCFRKWNSHDEAVPTISGWLTQIREKCNPTKQPMKATKTFFP